MDFNAEDSELSLSQFFLYQAHNIVNEKKLFWKFKQSNMQFPFCYHKHYKFSKYIDNIYWIIRFPQNGHHSFENEIQKESSNRNIE